MAAYWDLPPVSRNITTAVVLTSIGCIVGLIPTGLLIHHPSYLWMFPPQIWRLVTSFFIELHPLNLLFNAFFLYRYCTQLELGNPRFPRKVDLIYYILFVSSVILVSSRLHTRALQLSHVSLSNPPHLYCPDSALHLKLSRFLNMRKITPALRTTYHSHFSGLGCGYGGMSSAGHARKRGPGTSAATWDSSHVHMRYGNLRAPPGSARLCRSIPRCKTQACESG